MQVIGDWRIDGKLRAVVGPRSWRDRRAVGQRSPLALRALLLCLLLVTGGTLAAQDGSIDTSFDPGSNINGEVWSIALQPDGKVLIGGAFTAVGGVARNGVARLNADGSLDTSFNPGSGTNGEVWSMALQPDGKVLIGGYFATVNGVARTGVARLNADGSLDTSFSPGFGTNDWVIALALQPDGKILIGGVTIFRVGVTHSGVTRLNADGSSDTTFNPGSGANSDVWSLAVQPDGKVLIGGSFSTVDGVARNRVARLNANGSLDTSFNPGSGANFSVSALAMQPDGRVLIVGAFTTVNGSTRNHVARLNADGSLDASFNPGSGADNEVWGLALQPDGKVLIGGLFTAVGGVTRQRVARLHADGSLDTSFYPGSGIDGTVFRLVLQPDGNVLIGGWFNTVDGMTRHHIARLNNSSGTGGNGTGGNGSVGGGGGGCSIGGTSNWLVLFGLLAMGIASTRVRRKRTWHDTPMTLRVGDHAAPLRCTREFRNQTSLVDSLR